MNKDDIIRMAQQAEPAQEPVAWLQPKTVDGYSRPDLGYETCSKDDYAAFPVYPALAQEQVEPVQEPVAWYRPSIAPDYYAPVFVAGAQPPAPLTQTEARLLGWRPLVPPKAEPVQEPVAWRHKGAGHFTVTPLVSKFPEWEPLYTTPPQRKPLAEWQINDLMSGIDPEDVCSWSFRQGVYAAEKHHGVKL